MMQEVLDWMLAAGVVLGVFFMFYMAYRQQGILDTVKEIREIFQDKVDEAKDNIIYR